MADKNKPAGTQKGTPTKQKQPPGLQYTMGQAMTALYNTQGKAAIRKDRRIRQKQDAARTKALRRLDMARLPLNEQLAGHRCFPSIGVYGGDSVKSSKRKWMCSQLSQIAFREQNYSVRECEVRVFVEGAEVSAYLRGTINWTIQSTGGINTCSFTLNNNHDTFIITPANVCSGPDPAGWRLPRTRSGEVITGTFRGTHNTDEAAKWLIYRHKYRLVDPKGPSPQISETGEWLYPLYPFHLIFNRHDCVRVFYRLPHVSGMARTEKKKIVDAVEAWAPAFTGFISEYDYEDNPVDGDRVVNIQCYDWRGLLDRMRVRIGGNPLSSASDKNKDLQHPVMAREVARSKKNALEKGAQSKAFLQFAQPLLIPQEFIVLFNAAVDAGVRLNCNQDKSNYSQCVQGVIKQVLTDTQDDVSRLRTAYTELDAAVKTANTKDGRQRKLVRKAIADDVKIETKQKGAEDAAAIVQKAIAFLKSTGLEAERYAFLYASAYAGLLRFYKIQERTTSPEPGRAVQFELTNKEGAIAALDAQLQSATGTAAPIYSGAKIASYPKVDRVWLLDNYVRSYVTSLFRGVATSVLRDIDDKILDATNKNGVLFYPPVGLGSTAGLIRFTKAGSAGGNYAGANSVKVVTALQAWLNGNFRSTSGDIDKELDTRLQNFNGYMKTLRGKLDKWVERAKKVATPEQASTRRGAQLKKMIDAYLALHYKRSTNPIKQSEPAGNIADLVVTDAKFDSAAVGMYADLIKAMDKDPHPLSRMSFELAVNWLTLTHTPLGPGFEDKLSVYDRGKLQQWNMNMIFGILGRPLTFAEVTEIGKGTITELDYNKAPYSPLHAFVHMLLPKDGTGAQTIVQQDITHNPGAAKEYDYQTRLQLLNEICETLDYQFFCTPMGDLAFEFPNYNALPHDFGTVFQGAYTVLKGLRNFKLTGETGDLNTAWVLTGTEPEKLADNITGDYVTQNKFGKIVLVANVLARRIGVKVRKLRVNLPGVGAVLLGNRQPLSTLLAYGLLEIQRELGRMKRASVSYDFRPYLLPNRPIHVVHRQHIALVQSVNYSMAMLGEPTVTTDLHYVRGLRHDGTFAHIAGGHRMPVDYSGIFTGDVKQTFNYGRAPTDNLISFVRHTTVQTAERVALGFARTQESRALRDSVLAMQGKRKPRGTTDWSCGPWLKDRWIEAADSYSDQIDASFRVAEQYSTQTSGSGGEAGTLPPVTRGSRRIGARRYRDPGSKGEPAASVALDNTGIARADAGGEGSRTKKTKQSPQYIGNLYNPWPYGIFDKNPVKEGKTRLLPNMFNQWGFYRILTSSSGAPEKANEGSRSRRKHYKTHRGKIGGWHKGADFVGVPFKTKAYTPIQLETAHINLGVGWNGYVGSTAPYTWVRGPADWKKASEEIRFFGVRPKGEKRALRGPISIWPPGASGLAFSARLIGRTYKPSQLIYKVDTRTRDLYRSLRARGIKPNVDPSLSPKVGLMLTGYGFAEMPGAAKQKVACRLNYIHCADVVKLERGPGAGTYVGDLAKSRAKMTVPADHPVILVGNTGTNNVHLHLEMYVYPPGHEPGILRGKGATDPAAYKEVLKANADFLRTQMRMKLTAYDGKLRPGQLSDSWRRYFEAVNRLQGGRITTVEEATDYLLKKSSHYYYYTKPDSKKAINTNPLFFFRPEQIIKDLEEHYQKYRAKFGTTRFDERTGSSICGSSSALALQKVSLKYQTCLGQARKLSSASKKASARRACREARDSARTVVTGAGVQLAERKTMEGDRTERKLQQRIHKRVTREASDRTRRETPTTG